MKSQRHSSVRNGIAPIEFLMFLPVVIAFAAMTMYIIRIHEAKQRSTLNAEILAVEQAVLVAQTQRLAQQPGYNGTDSPDLAQLVTAFQQISDVKAGIVEGKSEVDSGEGVHGLVEPAGAAKAELRLLVHAWEADILPFPTERSQQPPLTLPDCVRGIAIDLNDLNQFSQLASLSSRSSNGSSNVAGQLAKAKQAAVQMTSNELQKLNHSIADMQLKLAHRQLDPLGTELETRELENRLRQARADRDQLSAALNQNRVSLQLSETVSH